MERKEIGHGWSDGALNYLCATQCNSAAIGSGVSSSTALEWHFKLGHSNLNKLKLLVPSLHGAPILRCESCELSKHTRASLPSRSRSRSNKLFELIHSNMWGPLAIPNPAQFKYHGLFVDDCSRMSWIYLMKERSEVFAKCQSFVNEIQTQHNATIKTFRSDNAL